MFLVSTSSYKLEVNPATINSVVDISFSLLASDIVGTFYNMDSANPMQGNENWWVTISLPSGWRYVMWDKTSLSVTMTGLENTTDTSETLKVQSCVAVGTCDDDNDVLDGYVNVMDLFSGRQDLINASSKVPISFFLQKSVISGPDASSFDSVKVGLAYETTDSTRFLSAVPGMRELAVDAATASTSSSLTTLQLSAMGVPSCASSSVHSSLLWMDDNSDELTLSFTTSTIINANSVNPKVCVDLRSSSCAAKSIGSGANISLFSYSSATYTSSGNPFLNLYEYPGDANLDVISVNQTYFCVENLLPSGIEVNSSWEINTDFTFQIVISEMHWKTPTNESQSIHFGKPVLAEILLIDQDKIQGSDCAQILVHAQTCTLPKFFFIPLE